MRYDSVIVADRRYGQLVAVRQVERDNDRHSRWSFKCDCGKIHIARGTHVKSGKISSCGCHRKFMNYKHGYSKPRTTEYIAWENMLARCYNPNNARFYRYGGRGISVCAQWLKFESFIADMGLKPSANLSIDRIDNDGNYEPKNVRWGTLEQQLETRSPRGPNRKF